RSLPLLTVDYAGCRIYGRPEYSDALTQALPAGLRWLTWLRHEWPYEGKSTYASGSLFHFVALLPAIVGPLVFPFVAIGVWRSILALPGIPGRGRGRGVTGARIADYDN